MSQPQSVVVNPVWLRLWHWLHALCFVCLLATGLSMHYADAGFVFVSFRSAVCAHNVLGTLMAALWVLFAVGMRLSGQARNYRLHGVRELHETALQLRYYAYGMFRGEPPPFPVDLCRKFNPVQKLTYFAVMYVALPLSVVSGLLLMFPLVAPLHVGNHPGLWPVAMLHLACGHAMSLFLVLHMYLSTTGGGVGTLYREMLTGRRVPSGPPRG